VRFSDAIFIICPNASLVFQSADSVRVRLDPIETAATAAAAGVRRLLPHLPYGKLTVHAPRMREKIAGR
jgi:hypothetical protein